MTAASVDRDVGSPRSATSPPRPSKRETTHDAVVALAASFTAEGLIRPLGFMLEECGVAAGIELASYNQVFQELLTPGSLLRRNPTGANVVLVRMEDYVRDIESANDARRLLTRTASELLSAFGEFRRASSVPTVVIVFRSTPSASTFLRADIDMASAELVDALGKLGLAFVLSSDAILDRCAGDPFDPLADQLAHIPYSDEYLAASAIVLARCIHALLVPVQKVLVLDCDNTIWRGVVGEDGPSGVGLDPPFLEVQRFAVEAQARGALICLASKNAEADVLDVFKQRTDMVLQLDHVVLHRINWEAKASNLRWLAKSLNLGLDSFVFLDDNPVECGLMREALPEVVTLDLPPLAAVSSFLRNVWCFDKVAVTQEDSRRTAMYRENSARDTLEAAAKDVGAFLAALELVIDISEPVDTEWLRLAQLTQRTNQFNFTTRRRSESELRTLASNSVVLAVRVRDRFGDYGLVGEVIATADGNSLVVDTFLLSCRVLGRGVEHAIVAHLGKLAMSRGLARVRFPISVTAKNAPARAFAASILADFRNPGDSEFDYVAPSEVVAEIVHQAGHDAEEVVSARRADAGPVKSKLDQLASERSSRYQRVAAELTSGAALQQAMAMCRTQRESIGVRAEASSATERALLAIWEDVLGIDGLGIDDDFFALGGSSLQAARMIVDVSQSRGVSLPLTSIIEAPTVRHLARRVDRGDVGSEGGLIALRTGGSRKLFLVHDGDGETLLYRNIARLVPDDVGVFGVQPKRMTGVPLAHTSIEDMASSYVHDLREVQPSGPYLLGGMCAGGLIAYEMAVQLLRTGEQVERVILFDAATPQAERLSSASAAVQMSRLGSAIARAREDRHGVAAAVAAGSALLAKIRSKLSYETQRLSRSVGNRARLLLLRSLLARGRAWPAFVPGLDFRVIYDDSERRYEPRPADVNAVLIRAAHGTGADTAYAQIYTDPTLGWGRLTNRLVIVDVDGGHSSMLQQPHAVALAKGLRPFVAVGGDA